MTVRANVHVHSGIYTQSAASCVTVLFRSVLARNILEQYEYAYYYFISPMSKRNSPMRRFIIAFITTHLTREAFGNFYEVSSLSCALIDGSENEQYNIYCAFFHDSSPLFS